MCQRLDKVAERGRSCLQAGGLCRKNKKKNKKVGKSLSKQKLRQIQIPCQSSSHSHSYSYSDSYSHNQSHRDEQQWCHSTLGNSGKVATKLPDAAAAFCLCESIFFNYDNARRLMSVTVAISPPLPLPCLFLHLFALLLLFLLLLLLTSQLLVLPPRGAIGLLTLHCILARTKLNQTFKLAPSTGH